MSLKSHVLFLIDPEYFHNSFSSYEYNRNVSDHRIGCLSNSTSTCMSIKA